MNKSKEVLRSKELVMEYCVDCEEFMHHCGNGWCNLDGEEFGKKDSCGKIDAKILNQKLKKIK